MRPRQISTTFTSLAPRSFYSKGGSGDGVGIQNVSDDPVKVGTGMAQEITRMELFSVFKQAPRSQVKGKILNSRWVLTTKRDEAGLPFLRARCVAQEFNFGKSKTSANFASTPPPNAVCLLIS